VLVILWVQFNFYSCHRNYDYHHHNRNITSGFKSWVVTSDDSLIFLCPYDSVMSSAKYFERWSNVAVLNSLKPWTNQPTYLRSNEPAKKVTEIDGSLVQSSKAQWLLYVPPGLTFTNSTFCPHSVFMCFVWISEQTAIVSLYSVNWLVFITETECI
jgi:hypothetical protein